jgi:hypothetical protein
MDNLEYYLIFLLKLQTKCSVTSFPEGLINFTTGGAIKFKLNSLFLAMAGTDPVEFSRNEYFKTPVGYLKISF